MQDGIIAGNGNSRYLKTVAAALSLYPDYESFMAALIAGTFPIDLNGINAGGWTQQGTPLNKANLFSDSTASSLGLSAANSPNDALLKLKQLIDSSNANANTRAKITVGTYTGDGSTERTINLGFTPKAVLLFSREGITSTGTSTYGGLAIQGTYVGYTSNGLVSLDIVTNGFKVYLKGAGQFSSFTNSNGNDYIYMAVYEG